MNRCLSILPLAAALSLTVLGGMFPCRAQAAGQSAPVTLGQRSAALAGAQGVVGKAAKAGSLSRLAPVLTNRSAGALGVMMAGFLGMGVKMGGDLSGGQGASPSRLSPVQMKADYDALLKHWGMSESDLVPATAGPHAVPPAVAKDGRGFLTDVAALLEKISPDDRGPSPTAALTVHDVTYTVLSPMRVRLGMKPKAGRKTMPPAEAVLEGGQWRLDLGDLQTMSSHSNE